jgi:transcription-repair coupling factor (superfamily II helicase)
MATSPAQLLRPGKALTLAQVADGAEGLVLADLARAIAARPEAPAISLCVICRDCQRMAALSRALAFFGPDILTMEFPAWDCLPYDRVSPNASVVSQRMTALSRLARVKGRDRPSILLTTVNAALQRVPAREFVATHALSVAPGNVLGMAGVVQWLRASTVREPGEYAVRGGISICFPPGSDMPVRFDFFGDAGIDPQLRSARPSARKTTMRALDLVPMAEFQLVTETIRRFRMGYVAQFGAPRATICCTKPSAKAAAIPAWSIGCRCSTSGWTRCSIISADAPVAIEPQARTPRASASSRSPIITRRARGDWSIPAAARSTSRCRPTGFI